ncbi:MAG: PHP domain-containing protein [Euryarchaeota archaeon]|nr:PHP domain-containing protein [Euryarchaeota archaeon]
MDVTAPVADLHLHTTASDGVLTIETLPAAARQAGVDWVAVTDHDIVHPKLSAPVTVLDGIRIIRGIELRVDAGDCTVDLLGYGVDPTPELTAELERLQENRQQRGQRIIERVESRLGVDLDIEPRPGIGRPHIARAIADSPAPYDVDRAFAELIGDGDPCYVARSITSFERGADLLSDAAAVVSLAHPFRYPDPESALELAADLDAIEYDYPYDHWEETIPLDPVCEQYDLLRTGGSDAHNETLGRAGLDQPAFDRFCRRLAQSISVPE